MKLKKLGHHFLVWKKTVFKKTGLFDRQFEGMRMGDGEFGARCINNGMLLISNPKAFCEDVKASEGGLRQLGSWDAFRSTNFFSSRPIPSVLYFWRKYWNNTSAIFALIQTVPLSLSPYSLKGRKTGKVLSLSIFILLFPIVLAQVLLSWYLSTQMLKSGDKISHI